MNIDFLIKRDFSVAGAFVGVADLKIQLLKQLAVVIIEDDEYFGVLTAIDVLKKQHILAIDCLSAKSQIKKNQTINYVLDLMQYENTEVLPVFEGDKIVGLVFQRDIIKYLSTHNEELQKEIEHQTRKFVEQNTELNEKILQQKNELETIIEQRTKELLDLVETKDRFIQIITNELRNPFSSILGLLKLLQQNIRVYDIDQIQKFLTQIYHSTHVTFDLLVDLIDWLNVNNKEFPLNPEKIGIHKLLTDEIITTSFIANQKRIVINNNIPEALWIYVDKNMLMTIFSNLINNATKFTLKDGEININATESGDLIEISVEDSGIGISTELIGKIFNDSIGDSMGTRNEEDKEIGFLFCKEFFEVEAGKIWIESLLGQGSIFKFKIPKFQIGQLENNQ